MGLLAPWLESAHAHGDKASHTKLEFVKSLGGGECREFRFRCRRALAALPDAAEFFTKETKETGTTMEALEPEVVK